MKIEDEISREVEWLLGGRRCIPLTSSCLQPGIRRQNAASHELVGQTHNVGHEWYVLLHRFYLAPFVPTIP